MDQTQNSKEHEISVTDEEVTQIIEETQFTGIPQVENETETETENDTCDESDVDTTFECDKYELAEDSVTEEEVEEEFDVTSLMSTQSVGETQYFASEIPPPLSPVPCNSSSEVSIIDLLVDGAPATEIFKILDRPVKRDTQKQVEPEDEQQKTKKHCPTCTCYGN